MARGLGIGLVVAALVIPAVAHADEWTFTQEVSASQGTSIRVVEPEGYTVTVNGKTETVPHVFAVDNADNYYAVRLTAPDGATWEKKIEVKAYKQTAIRARHVKGAAEPPSADKPRTFVGVAANLSHVCKKSSERRQIRLDFVADKVVKSIVLESRSREDLELAAGTYSVRLYIPQNGEWAYHRTTEQVVGKDGWSYAYKTCE